MNTPPYKIHAKIDLVLSSNHIPVGTLDIPLLQKQMEILIQDWTVRQIQDLGLDVQTFDLTVEGRINGWS